MIKGCGMNEAIKSAQMEEEGAEYNTERKCWTGKLEKGWVLHIKRFVGTQFNYSFEILGMSRTPK